VIAHLFLPGEESHLGHSRAKAIVERVMALPEPEVEDIAAGLIADFAARHRHYADLLARHASIVASRLGESPQLSEARTQLLGAVFTAEYSTEGAALLNPSAVVAPDQDGVQAGQVRAAISLRAVGEGHVSSIAFCSALIGPGPQWTFEQRRRPAIAGTTSSARWSKQNLRSVMDDLDDPDELSSALLHLLPDRFDNAELETAVARMYPELVGRTGGQASIDRIRRLVQSAYTSTFDDDVELSQRVLYPSVAEESNGMEDARFARFVDADGVVDYRGTYTAYDGRHIAPRLLLSSDLRTFRAHRLAGAAAHNKGMALFPRPVGGRHLALCRTNGESTGLSASDNGYTWDEPTTLHSPDGRWELLQGGNCGPPIETEHGWLVLTHSVGPMRVYTIAAMLLELDDPTKVIGLLREPLLAPLPDERDGYVPNVVYSCGGLIHDGRLWLPYGIDDARIAVAWIAVDELIDGLLADGAPTAHRERASTPS
jgi:predicted GH43/DUF377 family glycosyl hydrolase